MEIEGDYAADGYATIRGLIPPEVAANLFKQIQLDLAAGGKSFDTFAKMHPLSKQQTVDISGHFYRPLTTFLWSLTPIMEQLTGPNCCPATTISGSTGRTTSAASIRTARRANTAYRSRSSRATTCPGRSKSARSG